MASVVVASKDQISCELAGETTILSLRTSLYFSLDPVGTRVWDLIQKPVVVDAVLDSLLEEFEVEREQCKMDLVALLESLRTQRLIDIE